MRCKKRFTATVIAAFMCLSSNASVFNSSSFKMSNPFYVYWKNSPDSPKLSGSFFTKIKMSSLGALCVAVT